MQLTVPAWVSIARRVESGLMTNCFTWFVSPPSKTKSSKGSSRSINWMRPPSSTAMNLRCRGNQSRNITFELPATSRTASVVSPIPKIRYLFRLSTMHAWLSFGVSCTSITEDSSFSWMWCWILASDCASIIQQLDPLKTIILSLWYLIAVCSMDSGNDSTSLNNSWSVVCSSFSRLHKWISPSSVWTIITSVITSAWIAVVWNSKWKPRRLPCGGITTLPAVLIIPVRLMGLPFWFVPRNSKNSTGFTNCPFLLLGLHMLKWLMTCATCKIMDLSSGLRSCNAISTSTAP